MMDPSSRGQAPRNGKQKLDIFAYTIRYPTLPLILYTFFLKFRAFVMICA